MGNYYSDIGRVMEKIALRLFILEKRKVSAPGAEEPVGLFDIAMVKILGDQGEATGEALEERMEVSKGTLSATLNRQFKNGLLERRRSEQDRRIYRYRLSERGLRLYGDLNREEKAFVSEALSHITIHEEKAVLKFLSKLNQMVGSAGRK